MLSKFVSYSGLAGILGGALFAAAVILHPMRDGMSIHEIGVTYGVIHNIGAFGLMLQLYCLVGLFIRFSEVMKDRGLWRFILIFFGQSFYICLLVVDGLRNPLLAQFAPQAVHTPADSDPNVFVIVIPALILFFIGYLAFGTGLLSARIPSRLGGLLITFGGPIYIIGGISIFVLGPTSSLISVIEIVGVVPIGIGYVLLGWKSFTMRTSLTGATPSVPSAARS